MDCGLRSEGCRLSMGIARRVREPTEPRLVSPHPSSAMSGRLTVFPPRITRPYRIPWQQLLCMVSLLAASSSLASAGPGDVHGLDLDTLRNRVAGLGERVTELAGTDDLPDTLHFAWFDRPYARATLAILVKTTATLQREVRLRELGNGAIDASTIGAMLSWANDALERVVHSPPDSGFRPHRLPLSPGDLPTALRSPPLYGFVDRATATRLDDRFGDLDLIAAAGFRLYPRLSCDVLDEEAARVLGQRAEALGMTVIGVAAPRNGARSGDLPRSAPPPIEAALTVQPVTLRAMLDDVPDSPGKPAQILALTDLRWGESLAGSLARRAVARGVWPGARFVVDGWNPPIGSFSHDERNAVVAAAMWIHALQGQSLGLLHGWRDLRDGSASAYPSALVDPARVETVAHTALDLLRLGPKVTRFPATPLLALAVGPDAVDAQDENAWAAWVKPIWEVLLERQIRFDIVRLPAGDNRHRDRYRVVLPLRRDEVGDVSSVAARIERALMSVGEHLQRMTAREPDGTLAADVFITHAQTRSGSPCVAIANLSGKSRRLKLRGAPVLGAAMDVVSNTRVQDPSKLVSLAPRQVRLLWPLAERSNQH